MLKYFSFRTSEKKKANSIAVASHAGFFRHAAPQSAQRSRSLKIQEQLSQLNLESASMAKRSFQVILPCCHTTWAFAVRPKERQQTCWKRMLTKGRDKRPFNPCGYLIQNPWLLSTSCVFNSIAIPDTTDKFLRISAVKRKHLISLPIFQKLLVYLKIIIIINCTIETYWKLKLQ